MRSKKEEITQNIEKFIFLYEFYRDIITPQIYFNNLKIKDKENPNIRLWVLRCMLGFSEKEMAEKLGIPLREYKKYEKIGNKIPEKILKKISKEFGVSLKWLKCESYEWFPEIKGEIHVKFSGKK